MTKRGPGTRSIYCGVQASGLYGVTSARETTDKLSIEAKSREAQTNRQTDIYIDNVTNIYRSKRHKDKKIESKSPK